MIRGVNRRVVEINECKSEFFKRAIFFVRPGASDNSPSMLQKEADAIIASLSSQPVPSFVQKRKPRISRRALWLFLGISVAISVISLICNFL